MLTRTQPVCYGRADMRSGVEMGRDAQARGNACVPSVGADLQVAHRQRPTGLILTHEMFSAKVESSTVSLRISGTATTGLGRASFV